MSVSNKTVLWLVVILLVVVVFCMWNKKQEKFIYPFRTFDQWNTYCETDPDPDPNPNICNMN